MPAVGGWLGSLAPNQTIGVQPRLPSGAAAVGNLTVVQPGAGGYLTTWSGDTQRPLSSVLNVQPPVIRPNLAVIRPGGSGNFLVFSSGGQHDLLFDLTGWFAYG